MSAPDAPPLAVDRLPALRAPAVAVAPAVTPAPAATTTARPRPRPAWRRGLRRLIVDHAVSHLTLLSMGLLFVFPFVWMLGMSLKTDEEAAGATAFPAVPTFRAASPFVRAAADVDAPARAGGERWRRLYPRLVAEAEAALSTLPLPAAAGEADAGPLRRAAAVEAVRRAIGRLDESVWAAQGVDDAGIVSQFRAAMTDAELAASLDERLGRFELGGVQVRSLTGRVNAVGRGGNVWSIVSGGGDLVSSGAAQVLRYRFADASAAPVVVRTSFDAAVDAEALHRIVVSYRGDASWHAVSAELRLGDRTYVSDRSTYLAQHRGASLLLQPPTFQDETLTPRNWVPLRPVATGGGAAAAAPTEAVLTLTLWPSSTGRAVWGKVERNYARAFRAVPFWTYVGNSIVIVLLQLAGTLFSSGFVGYAFARLNWPGRSLAMGLLLATMMLPGQVTMIPTFLIWRALGWYNTLNPLWAGAWFGNAFFIFLMVQHMRTLPRELDEAARIDGMNAVQTWWYVIMPQVKPTLAAIAIMTFMGAWNEFMGPLIMLRDQAKFPLSLGLFSMRLDAGSDWPLIMAGNLLMTLPVVVIFFLFQRYFIEGVTVSGIKG